MMSELIAGLAAAALAGSPAGGAEPLVIATSAGQVAGQQVGDVGSWLGIPFAAPPIGALRWRSPQPVEAWTGIRDAMRYAPACPQALVAPTQLSVLRATSEDCLYLNIWSPMPSAGQTKHPVMLWLHGGGFIAGTGAEAQFDGSALARHGVVVVTINYRLGRLGFFAHPAIDRDHPDEPKGNFGLQDQIAALHWAHDNIAAFGGDPARVTLFGESAGGASILMLMTSPAAQGLFHQAIVQSGAVLLDPRDRTRAAPGKESASKLGADWAAQQGIAADSSDAAERLRALAVETIAPSAPTPIEAMTQVLTGGPMVDGQTLTDNPMKAFREGREAKLPLVIGYNSAEGMVWSFGADLTTIPIAPMTGASVLERIRDAGLRQTVDQTIQTASGGDARRRETLLVSDGFMGAPALAIAALHARQAPVWFYHFDAVPTPAQSVSASAPHGTEIFYAFGTLDRFRYRPEAISAADRSLSGRMMSDWSHFAAHGSPTSPGDSPWPVFRSEAPQIHRLSTSDPTLVPEPQVSALRTIMIASDPDLDRRKP